jgi:protein-L-isoaspartate(D-aspartate) O-methyltransferase
MSSYQAAVLGELARDVWSVEIVPELAEQARERLSRSGYSNVHVVMANGSVGLPGKGPFDNRTSTEALLDCVFVPLVGGEGWRAKRRTSDHDAARFER